MKLIVRLESKEMSGMTVGELYKCTLGEEHVGDVEVRKNDDGTRDLLITVFEGFEEEVENAMRTRHHSVGVVE